MGNNNSVFLLRRMLWLVNSLNNFIYGFIGDKLKRALVAALFISGILMFINYRFSLHYFIGFLIGCTNFIGLSLGANHLLTTRPRRSGIMHFIFFTLRYAVVAYLIATLVMNKGGNPLVIVLGFLTLNLSIKYSAFKEYFSAKKEG